MAAFGNPEAYEQWMGRWSALLAKPFADFAELPETGRMLDVGCGAGALTDALLSFGRNRTVVGIDPSMQYVEFCRARFSAARSRFAPGDAMAIPFEKGCFDAVLSLLILQEIPDAAAAAREMCRVARPGGRVAACQWHFAGGLPMLGLFWEAAVETLDDAATRATAASEMEVAYPEERDLRRLWETSRLVDVRTRLLETSMNFSGFDDYWAPFTSGVSTSSSLAGSLTPEMRTALEDRLRRKLLGDGDDRPFTLPARAWAIRGTVPDA